MLYIQYINSRAIKSVTCKNVMELFATMYTYQLYKAICLQVFMISLCGFATKITYLAQVARMFTFIGFLCTGETDSFPETKKKNVEILHEIIAFVSTITKSKQKKKKKHCRLTFPRCRVPFPMSPKYI